MGVRFGRYELLRPVGRGGMAEVFLARYLGPEGFEKRLVIKRVLPALGADRRFLRLFFDEARTQVSLSHGNLVPVFDFGRVGNAYFIAMEHVHGCDLGTLLSAAGKRGEKLPPRLVAHIGIELCRGLAYVHRRGFVHRDVSPRNVLVSVEGEVKLSDFGVALASASEAAPGVRGTVAYMAPEQARGERTDARADLFALAMVLAEALTGRRVRPSADDAAALEAARNGGKVAIEGPLAAVIARATEASPEARYADAEAMLLALEQEATTLGRVGAAAARELAARVAEWVPPRADDDADEVYAPGPPTAPTVGEETYFRDRKAEAESFVDEVLERPAAAPAPVRARTRSRAWWWAAATVVVGAAGVVVAARSVQSQHRRAGDATPPVAAPPSIAQAPPPIAQAAPPAPAPTAAPHITAPAPSPTPVPAPARHPPPRRPAGSGTLLIQCTPWCIPSVDDEVRGADGRNHRLTLSAGAHRVSVRRLDDRLQRTVEIHAGQSETVDFTFE
ncbi:MAG TPA: serine/threonine-protein kinase [Polyangia bacterium]